MPTHPTEPNLRSTLLAASTDHSVWSTPTARVVLDHALTTLRPIALRLQADPADALSYAFETWMGMSADTIADESIDLWAYTRAAVRRCLDREDEAGRRATSVAGLRRAGTRDIDVTTGIDGIDLAYEHIDIESDDDTAPSDDPRTARALAALEQVLTMAGFSPDQRTVLVDVFADLVASSPSQRASIERALSVRELIAPTISEPQWRNLVEVILGTPAGNPGILALAGDGHPAPAMEKHISSRLLAVLTLAA